MCQLSTTIRQIHRRNMLVAYYGRGCDSHALFETLKISRCYESGTKIFENANEHEDGTKHINAIVIGMGNYGTEMIKALAWYCQMDGYRVNIDAFALKSSAESEFKVLCPDLMSSKHNGAYVKGDSEYTIRIHSGINVNSAEFLKG